MSDPIRQRPIFSRLTDEESRGLLARNHVGRLAYIMSGRVDIEPIHYAAGDSCLYIRSAQGAKLEAFKHKPYVAFEVDEVDGMFDWRSVVVHGTIYLISDPHSHSEHVELDHALRTMRTFLPETLTQNDPTPFRQTIYGLHIDSLSGRKGESA